MNFNWSNMSVYRFLPLFISSLGAVAFAQENQAIQEIIVSADFRQQSLAEIPGSVSIISNELIERRHARHLEEILLDAPNVNIASGSNRARFFQIRGIGERGQFAEPLNSSVGVMIDQVDYSGAGNAALLYDVEQVEVLMGPQGTRYGSNALVGLINIKTRDPQTENGFGMQVEAADYASHSLGAYVTGPLSETLQYRLSGLISESDGFSTNLNLDRPTNQRQENMLRGKLSWQASETVNLDLSLSRLELDNGYDAFSLDNTRDTLSDQPGVDRLDSQALSANLSIDSFAPARLEIITGFSDSDIVYGYDEDWTYTGFHPFEYSSTDYYFRDRDTASTELRLISKDDGLLFNDSTNWIVGLYRLQQEVSLRRAYTYLPTDFTSQYEIERLAVFAESNTSLNSNWSFDIGLRLEQFDATYTDSTALNFMPDESLSGGKLALNYHTADAGLFYLSAARGYKAGGFNTDGSLDADLREFDSEELWNYEIGYKGSHLNDTLQAQIALFYMDREEVQIASSTTRLRPDMSTEFIDYTGNAAEGSNYGLELSGNWQLQNDLSFFASAGLLKSKYANFINSAGDDLSGREQAHAPSYQFSVGTEYFFSSSLSINLNVQGKDRFYYSDSHNLQSEAYALLNASLNWQLDDWRISLWGRNLTDKDYFVRGYYFGNDPRDGYTAKAYTQFGEPRRVGLSLSADF
ncbi:MAG: TonB-dependent receptor [Gammaproteobacteria bacterium]|nr:TonB-dependent receptor [Gammaproteobacteria bacterium]|tara:strand:+ start:22559 stop:24640 length:2082 start_codon:yes stop_codon:yes gene_type:complete